MSMWTIGGSQRVEGENINLSSVRYGTLCRMFLRSSSTKYIHVFVNHYQSKMAPSPRHDLKVHKRIMLKQSFQRHAAMIKFL